VSEEPQIDNDRILRLFNGGGAKSDSNEKAE